MKFFAASRKKLPLALFLAAGTLSPCVIFAEETTRDSYDVADGDALRKYLSETYLPEGAEKETYRDNADLNITQDFRVDTTATETSEDADGNESAETTATGSIEVLATGSKILGGGRTISSSEVDLSVKGAGDVFFLDGVTLSVENVAFAGTTDETKKTGRVFTTGNSAAGTTLDIGAGTRFENRRLVADERTNYRAQGGALVSAHIMDEIRLASGENGDVVFSGNLAHGREISYENSSGETASENLAAAGGAVFASGLLEISGAGTTRFENNRAVSDAAAASGGAVFITDAKLNADGSASDTVYPDDVFVGEGVEKNFGLQVSETTLDFSDNAARGASAQGGAIAVSGGWLDAKNARVNFSGNAAENLAENASGEVSSVGGGALVVMDGGRAAFDAGTTLDFSGNEARGNAALSAVSGGAVAVSDAELSLAGTTTFSGNAATASAAGASVSGGAAYFSGTLEETTGDDGEKTQTHTASVSLAGTLTFSENFAEASALAYAPPAEDEGGEDGDAASSAETSDAPVESSATGGALVVAGAKLVVADGAELSSLAFDRNAASAKTFAQGGALASTDEASEVALETAGAFSFSENKAELLALGAGEAQTDGVAAEARGGAVYVSAGTLDLASAAGTLSFSGNAADAFAQADASARGGAIYQSGGTLALGAAEFSGNAASARTVAQGGALYSAGGAQTIRGAAVFSENRAEAGTTASEIGAAFARGGAIFSASGGNQIFERKAEFSGNAAEAFSVAGTDENGKRTGAAGGAVYSSGTLAFAGADFLGNAARVSGDENGAAFGGAVYVAGGALSSSAGFSAAGNEAAAGGDAQGGALYLASAGVATLSGAAEFSENSASAARAAGGAIYSAGTLRVDAGENGTVSLTKNSASASSGDAFGGAVSAAGGSIALGGKTVEISGNAATTENGGNAYGGALYLRGASAELTNATISGNAATAENGGNAYGGGAFLDVASSNVSLTLAGNTKISGNSSTTGGAGDGIYVGSSAAGTAAAAGTATLVFHADADVSENEDGTTSRENVEIAEISDKITVAAGTLALRKTGAGDLTLGDVSVGAGTAASFDFSGGNVTLGGAISAAGDGALEKFSVGADASVELTGTLGKFSEADIAGTLSVASGAHFTLAETTTLASAGTLALNGATATVSGATAVSGAGTFFVKDATLNFSGDEAALSADTLSVGAGTLALDGSGTLSVAEKLVFTETGSATVTLSENATLAVTEVARAADGVNVTIDGTGTLMLYVAAEDAKDGESAGEDEEEAAKEILFSAFSETVKDEAGNETTVVREGSFTIGSGVKLKAGISVGEGATLSLSPDSQTVGAKNVLLSGGALVASGTTRDKPLEFETLAVSGSGSKLGDGASEQFFRMAEVASTGDDGSATTETHALNLTGSLEIAEKATFSGNVSFGGTGAELSGAGTVEGDVSGTGTLSLARVDGNLNVANGRRMTLAGTVAVSGDVNVYSDRTTDVSQNARFAFSDGASLSAANFRNYGNATVSGAAEFSGNFVNAGTLTVGENSTFSFADGSTFSNGVSAGTEVLNGVIDLSAANSALDFSAVSDEGGIDLSRGSVMIDATALSEGDALPILGIESEEILSGVAISDVNGYDLDDRFEWDAGTGTLVFNGLNGSAFRGSIYGDLQREGVNRTHEFMRSALLRGTTRPLTPQLFGANKLESPYMRGYLEKMRQRGGEVSAALEARRKEELALAEKLNARLANFWAQGDFSFREQRERHGAEAYDATIAGAMVGAAVPFGSWELGLVLGGGEEEYETKDAAVRHEVTTDAYGLAGYGVYRNGWFDWTLGAAGMYASSDSKRGEYSGDFDAWRLGAMTEVGATLRAQSWLAIRVFGGLSAAYSRVGSFDESGAGKQALSVESGGAFGLRSSLGISSAFMVTDALQLSARAAWLLDFGKDTYSLDAYMPGTRTDYVIDSRENEASALEAGAYLNWAFAESVELFGGYTGTIRAGERAHAISVGLNYFF